jgi:hypothetical protein
LDVDLRFTRINIDLTQSIDNLLLELTTKLSDVSIRKEDYNVSNQLMAEIKHNKPCSYVGICVNDIKPLLEHKIMTTILSEHPEIIIQKEFHITLEFLGGVISSFREYPYINLIDKEVSVSCVGVCCDNKGCAALVNQSFPCENKYPHITIGNAKSVKAVYSNELIKNNIDTMIKFQEPVMLTGIVKRV